jgi:serine/threonine-protein kinase HipA
MSAVLVYADWEEFETPEFVGVLRQSLVRNREHFSFRYDDAWLGSAHVRSIDPDLALYQGDQHAGGNNNFRTFLDSCPDRWGRTLMQRREAILARVEGRDARRLTAMDYLLGVHDTYRMGALRFKKEENGSFLNNVDELAVPPISALIELEQAAWRVQDSDNDRDPEMLRWLGLLISPGSSLGGARPKASVLDEGQNLWIAKFPGRQDDYDVAAWEYVTYRLAVRAGIAMAPCRIQTFGSQFQTFMTKRFDRTQQSRIHFSSAMTQLGYYDGLAEGASYLEIAEFLTKNGGNVPADLPQLWRRIVFNIAVSNTDDHLRNHGFLLTPRGWVLSPAYDINPNIEGPTGLTLNIDEYDNSLSFDLVMSVARYFRLTEQEAGLAKDNIIEVVSSWREEANRLGLSIYEQDRLALAFRTEK